MSFLSVSVSCIAVFRALGLYSGRSGFCPSRREYLCRLHTDRSESLGAAFYHHKTATGTRSAPFAPLPSTPPPRIPFEYAMTSDASRDPKLSSLLTELGQGTPPPSMTSVTECGGSLVRHKSAQLRPSPPDPDPLSRTWGDFTSCFQGPGALRSKLRGQLKYAQPR